MDKSSIIGIILGFIAVGVGMVLKGVSPSVLMNPAAILIIIAGTIAAVSIAFPTSELKRIPSLFKIIFGNEEKESVLDVIQLFSDLAVVARRDGLLALEAKLNEIEDPFLKSGLTLAIDGQSPEYIRDVLDEEIDAMKERHNAGALIFTQAGTYAPTLGVLGAVVGLIAALGNLSDTNLLGHAIAAAFVATLMGIFTGYVLWHPFANKLKRKSKSEIKRKEIMIEGILSVLEGQPPRLIEQKLAVYLPIKDRLLINSGGEKMDE
ncbi:flagellar motor stator protein MotA [Bacillus sp. EAC]|uniref:flagellar motor stator protein MotA n=1 Tax=Bacillus sp. EAC TaxID=1978338 RepID=UPI000B444726|nr:flagellar motor stator protein MotA [Bacillus sp. EAC]